MLSYWKCLVLVKLSWSVTEASVCCLKYSLKSCSFRDLHLLLVRLDLHLVTRTFSVYSLLSRPHIQCATPQWCLSRFTFLIFLSAYVFLKALYWQMKTLTNLTNAAASLILPNLEYVWHIQRATSMPER